VLAPPCASSRIAEPIREYLVLASVLLHRF
jgi:hypothetical protein